jgi:hypothetical protein
MAVDFLQKTAVTAVRGRPFRKGQSGNPAGRPPGVRNRATQNAQLLLEGEAETLTRKAVELALDGDPRALRLCLDRLIAPRRERSIRLTLPPIDSVADIAGAMAAITTAIARGDITPGEALELTQVVETFARAIETREFERRRFKVSEMPNSPPPWG